MLKDKVMNGFREIIPAEVGADLGEVVAVLAASDQAQVMTVSTLNVRGGAVRD